MERFGGHLCHPNATQVREVRGRDHTRGRGRAEGADIVAVARKGWQVQEGGVRKGQS